MKKKRNYFILRLICLLAMTSLLLPACQNENASSDGRGTADESAFSGSAGAADESTVSGGAGAEEESGNGNENENGNENGNEKKYRVGSAVSGAYAGSESSNVSEIKATGYEYDRDTLEYELVWSDEFDYEGEIDSTKWSYDIGGSGWGNNELQYYTSGDNASVYDGILHIELKKEDRNGRNYTSSRIVTKNKGDWKYCKIEVSAKIPSGKGTWPAIWLLSTSNLYGTWPKSGEIDIMEHVGYDQNRIYSTVHTELFNSGSQKGSSRVIEGVSDEFHVYGLEWLPDCLIFTVDGEEIFTYNPSKYTSEPKKNIWPFDEEMYLILNLAYGGDWGGAKGTDDDCLPACFEIDYVRVYQCSEFENY